MTNILYILSAKGGAVNHSNVNKDFSLFKHVKSFNCHVLTQSLTDASTGKLVVSLLEVLSSYLGPLFRFKVGYSEFGLLGIFPMLQYKHSSIRLYYQSHR